MNYSLGLVDNPRQLLHDLAKPCCVTFDFLFPPFNTENPTALRLTALCLLSADDMEYVVVSQREVLLTDGQPERVFKAITVKWGLQSVSLRQPWQLQTLRLTKPWGAEIWYTGHEARGTNTVQGMPLPWLLALSPAQTLGAPEYSDPILLKILDPLPDEAFGDLYFELHEQKIEVYIVTHINRTAWPDGIGYIRYGFNQDRVASFNNVAAFKSAYLDVVEAYRQIRSKIDDAFDIRRDAAGIAPGEPLEPELQVLWNAELAVDLRHEEARRNQEMYAFTELRPLRVGDVIRVNPNFPHSLQHGVRVIEFQTAHYERHILSFNQKVLTQDHWDTERAMENAIIEAPVEDPLEVVNEENGYKTESVARFPQFSSLRITLDEGATYRRSMHLYLLVIGVSGEVIINDVPLRSEQAVLLPADVGLLQISAVSDAVVLLAEPGIP